jgi:lysozyme
MIPPRIAIAALTLSASALVGIALHEGYSPVAYVPVAGDRPTLGFGDAQGVKPGDKTTPVRALIRLNAQAESFQRELRACIGDVPMHQHEWDSIVSWAFNVGSKAACDSTLVKKLKAGDYTGMCAELLRWDRFQGRRLAGLTKRRQAEHAKCIGAQ